MYGRTNNNVPKELPSTACGCALLAKYAVIRMRSSNISHSTKLTIHLSYGWTLDVINKKPAAQKNIANCKKKTKKSLRPC